MVSRFYAIDEANAALPEVERILAALRDQRAELIALRDRVVAASPPDDETPTDDAAEKVRLLRLGMQGLIDQMQAGVARLVELDITLRDISTGLIDFPALVSGRPIWLCWRLGEDGVARLVELDITLRDISTGLIDFPALVSGRPIWLCWRLGEDDVAHWHAVDEGFDSRRPLSELPMGRSSGSPA